MTGAALHDIAYLFRIFPSALASEVVIFERFYQNTRRSSRQFDVEEIKRTALVQDDWHNNVTVVPGAHCHRAAIIRVIPFTRLMDSEASNLAHFLVEKLRK